LGRTPLGQRSEDARAQQWTGQDLVRADWPCRPDGRGPGQGGL